MKKTLSIVVSSCDNFFKEEVGHERCLGKKEVKKGIKNIIHFLTRENEKGSLQHYR